MWCVHKVKMFEKNSRCEVYLSTTPPSFPLSSCSSPLPPSLSSCVFSPPSLFVPSLPLSLLVLSHCGCWYVLSVETVREEVQLTLDKKPQNCKEILFILDRF